MNEALQALYAGDEQRALRRLSAFSSGGADLDRISPAPFAQVTPLGTAATAGGEPASSTAAANGDDEFVALIRSHGG